MKYHIRTKYGLQQITSAPPPADVEWVDLCDVSTDTLNRVVDGLMNTQVTQLSLNYCQGVSLKRLTLLKSVLLDLRNIDDYIYVMNELPPSCTHLTLFASDNEVTVEWKLKFNQALLRLRDQLVHLEVYLSAPVFAETILLMPKLIHSGFYIGYSCVSLFNIRDIQRKQLALVRVLPPDIGYMVVTYI